ncbi:MAG: type I-E CRISPR-associated endoribonuclease Cas2e [Fimbriimonadaceae bacterium]
MVVLIVTAVRPGLRGELSRWMIEPQAGVFVGNLPARVRDRLWDKVVQEIQEGSAVILHSARTEQGFTVKVHGDRTRIPVDFEGLTLISRRVSR